MIGPVRSRWRQRGGGALLAGLVTLGSTACRSTTRAQPPDSPAPASESASDDEPMDLALVGNELAITPIPVTLRDDYVHPRDTVLSDLATPWASATAEALGVDPMAIAKAMDLGEPSEGAPVILTTHAHGDRRWMHVTSASAQIYELEPIRLGDGKREVIAVLVAFGPPDSQIIDVFDARWTVGLLDRQGHLLAVQSLDTAIPPIEAMWDVIDTALDVHEGQLRVVVTYGHSGGGDPCDERFEFRLRVDTVPRIAVLRREHEPGRCRP